MELSVSICTSPCQYVLLPDCAEWISEGRERPTLEFGGQSDLFTILSVLIILHLGKYEVACEIFQILTPTENSNLLNFLFPYVQIQPLLYNCRQCQLNLVKIFHQNFLLKIGLLDKCKFSQKSICLPRKCSVFHQKT